MRFVFFTLIGLLLFSPKEITAVQEQITYEHADSSATTTSDPHTSIDTFSLFIKTLGVVAAFSFLLYLVLRLYRNNVYGKGFGNHSSQIKVLASSGLSPKKSLCIVKVLDHFLVLGLSEEQITVLLDVPAGDMSERLKKTFLEEKDISDPSFKKILNNWIRK